MWRCAIPSKNQVTSFLQGIGSGVQWCLDVIKRHRERERGEEEWDRERDEGERLLVSVVRVTSHHITRSWGWCLDASHAWHGYAKSPYVWVYNPFHIAL